MKGVGNRERMRRVEEFLRDRVATCRQLWEKFRYPLFNNDRRKMSATLDKLVRCGKVRMVPGLRNSTVVSRRGQQGPRASPALSSNAIRCRKRKVLLARQEHMVRHLLCSYHPTGGELVGRRRDGGLSVLAHVANLFEIADLALKMPEK